MYYLYGKINRGHGICPLYGGCPHFGESVIRGFTVVETKIKYFITVIHTIFFCVDIRPLVLF